MLGRKLVLVPALVLLPLVACGGNGGDSGDGGSENGATTTESPPTTSTEDAEAEVIAAYEAAYVAFNEASRNPANPDHPALAETRTGESLRYIRDTLTGLSEAGEYFGGPPLDHDARVTEISPDQASVEDCLIDHTVHYAADGSVIAEGTGRPVAARAVMLREEGTWKLAALTDLHETCER
jgi:hypothetical protein